MPKYLDFNVKSEMYSKDKDFHLQNTYNNCVTELTAQQTKRDQTIAFYIAVISFAIPSIIDLKMGFSAKAAALLVLFLLGCMLTRVIARYRVYKEVYWITCRTISQLYLFDQNRIDKDVLQGVFYRTLRKNAGTVLVMDGQGSEKINKWKTFRKIFQGAEATLYLVMAGMSAGVLWISILLFFNFSWAGYAAATVLALADLFYWSRHYYKQLTSVYYVVKGKDDPSFNAVYSKAWFLHYY